MDKVTAPFTPEQVKNLNDYQEAGYFHPFTCGTDSGHQNLVATPDGWVCKDCAYTQNWAHGFMAEPLPPLPPHLLPPQQ